MLTEAKIRNQLFYRYTIVFGGTSFLGLFLLYNFFDTFSNLQKGQHPLIITKGKASLPPVAVTRRKTQIAFLKVPKTGSTTLACVFLKFGLRHNLTMFVPTIPVISDDKKGYLLKLRLQFNIFAIHTHYNHYFFTHIVKNPAIIGSVRNPETRLISHAFFFLKKKKAFRELSSQVFINEIIGKTNKYEMRNVIAAYFGIQVNAKTNKTELIKVLKKINSEFTLVLVVERLDESLVLMKRLLHWSFVDIVYERKKTSRHAQVYLNTTQKKTIRHTNALDFGIYNFFSNELNKKIRKAGKDFQEEVRYFKDVLNAVKVFCTRRRPLAEEKYIFPSSKWDTGFSVFRNDCEINKYSIGRLKNEHYKNL